MEKPDYIFDAQVIFKLTYGFVNLIFHDLIFLWNVVNKLSYIGFNTCDKYLFLVITCWSYKYKIVAFFNYIGI